jgi:hypothetical protein
VILSLEVVVSRERDRVHEAVVAGGARGAPNTGRARELV